MIKVYDRRDLRACVIHISKLGFALVIKGAKDIDAKSFPKLHSNHDSLLVSIQPSVGVVDLVMKTTKGTSTRMGCDDIISKTGGGTWVRLLKLNEGDILTSASIHGSNRFSRKAS